MTVESTPATKTSTGLLGRAGLVGTVLSGVALVVPLASIVFAAVTGSVTLATADDITALFTRGIIITGAAAALGLVALGLNTPGALADPRRGLVTTGASAGLLVVSAALLFAVVVPRASAVSHLNSDIVPFAIAMRDDCKTPLNAITPDLAKARDDAQANLTSDSGFAVAMQADAQVLSTDLSALSTALTPLKAATVPDPKYQQLKDDCVAGVTGEIGFLSNPNDPNAIPLPPPYNAFQPKVSAIQLIQLSGQIAAGKGPIQEPSGTIEPLVHFALDQIVTTMNNSPAGRKLRAEGDSLTQDIKDTLTNNLAPFKSSVPVQ